MRIQGPNPHVVDRGQTETKRSENGAEKAAETKSSAVVVSIGKAASGASEAAAKLSTEIASRLEAVRAQLRDGTYGVDFDRLAERIVDDEVARAGER